MYFLLFYLKDMFGKKILFLLTGYIAGNAVASVYSGKHKKFKKPESAKDVQHMVEQFLHTQKRFISDVEKKYLSEENKQKLLENSGKAKSERIFFKLKSTLGTLKTRG